MITARIVKKKGGGWDELKKYLTQLHKDYVEVGYFNDQGIYPSKKNTQNWSYANLMAYHELQADKNLVPLRPVFGSVTKTQKNALRKQTGKFLRNQLRGTYYHRVGGDNSPQKLYSMLGRNLGQVLKTRFGSRGLARNELSTIKRKGSRLPMIDKGHLRDAVSYKLKSQTSSRRA